jgi:hypothetical protein
MKLLLLYPAVVAAAAAAATLHATCDMLECTALPILRIYALFLLLKHLGICMFSPYYESSLFSSSH